MSTFTAVEELKQKVQGELLAPSHPEYDAARKVWNGMVDKRPVLIARCVEASDVVACIRFARERDVPLSVRGGGHNYAGKAVCDDGLVIDFSQMKWHFG
jgi:FAD/FMN-containing dehydrogenase